MPKHPIIALVGPSGSGKTSLLLEILKRYPKQCGLIKSKVTRQQRDDQDALFYDFVTPSEFERLLQSGQLFQHVYYANHHYGCSKEQTDTLLQTKLGLVVIIEQSVADFIRAGYELILIKVIPIGHVPRPDAARLKADAERSHIKLNYAHEIVNSFAPGGLEAAVAELAEIVEPLLPMQT